MNQNEILHSLQAIFRDLLDEEDFNLDITMTAEDIPDWDSLFHITLMAVIADEFGIVFSTEEIISMRSIAKIVKAIETKKQ